MTGLVESRAKLARAREHIQAFESEHRRIESHPHTSRMEYDEETGWATVYFDICVPVEDIYRLSGIAGDICSNFRSALDYVVTAMVEASGATLHGRHQFPIFDSRDNFRRHVGTNQTDLKPGGPLGGTTLGFDLIERYQPYQRGDRRAARVDVLQSLYRLSNADKHRSILHWYPSHQPSGRFIFGGCEILDSRGPGSNTHLSPPTDRTNHERPVIHFLLSGPPTDYYFEGSLTISILVRSYSIDGEPESTWLAPEIFHYIGERVSLLIDLFEQIL